MFSGLRDLFRYPSRTLNCTPNSKIIKEVFDFSLPRKETEKDLSPFDTFREYICFENHLDRLL